MSAAPGMFDPLRLRHGREWLEEVYTSDATYQIEQGGADAEELLRCRRAGSAVGVALTITGVLGLLGVGAFLYLMVGGPEPRVKWGYSAAMLAFLLTAAQSGPIVAVLVRLTKAYWAIPLRRAADLLGVAGLITAPVYMILLFQLPDFTGRPSLWFDYPMTPLVPDSALVAVLALGGLSLIYLGAVPDLALSEQPLFRRLAGRWQGTVKQWAALELALIIQGSLYVGVYVVMNWLLATDLGGSLIPGWHSENTPVYLSFSGFEAGLAFVVLASTMMKLAGGLHRFFEKDVYNHMAKLLLGFALLFMWFLWAELLVWWYGRENQEKLLQHLLYYGPYVVPFALAVGFSFLAPLLLMMWIQVRESFFGPTLVAIFIILGTYADRVRFFVASWSLAGPVQDALHAVPPAHLPNVVDVLILIGGPCGFIFVYLLLLRVLPPIALWEHREDLLHRIHRPYLRTEVKVLAKQS